MKNNKNGQVSPFKASLLEALCIAEPTTERLTLTHGTSLFNLTYSLAEGGKPATSFALGKVDPDSDMGDTSLTKFGEIIIALKPDMIFDKDFTIFTRDAYTMDSPNREIYSVDKKASIELSEKLKPFIKHTDRDISEIIRSNSQTREVQPFTSVADKISNDRAFQMSFLHERGVDINIPYASSRTPSTLDKELAATLGNSLDIVKGASLIPEVHKEALLNAYDNHYRNLAENSDRRFHQVISRKRLEEPDDERFRIAVDCVRDWISMTENPPTRLDTTALDEMLSVEIAKFGTSMLLNEAMKATTSIIEHEIYSCYDHEFDTKEEAWDYIHENSHAQTQQSLTYSVNEIFSLKSEEIKPQEVVERLGMITPEKFLGGVDNPSSVAKSVLSFNATKAELETALDFDYTTTSNDKSSILDRVATGELTGNGALGERATLTGGARFASGLIDDKDKENSVFDLVEKLQTQYYDFTPTELEQVAFENSYQKIRDLRNDLDTLLEVRELTFGESRNFNKEFYGKLVSHRSGDTRNFSVDSAIKTRKKYGRTSSLDANYSAISSTMSELAECFENLPEDVPYFEVVMNRALTLDSDSILSISAPERYRVDLEYLTTEYPYLSSKVKFYDEAVVGSLSADLIASGAAVEPESLSCGDEKRQRRRGLSLNP